MKIITAFLLLVSGAVAVDVRVHNATAESVTVESVVIAPGEVAAVTLPGTFLHLSRTTTAGDFESWATEVSARDLVSLQPAGRLNIAGESVDYVGVFLRGFYLGCAWELFGLLLRLVRKTVSQTTSV